MTRTFGNSDVAGEINKSLVAVSLKAEEEEALIEALEISVFPTTVVLSHDRKVLARLDGYVPPAAFQRRLAEVVTKHLRR